MGQAWGPSISFATGKSQMKRNNEMSKNIVSQKHIISMRSITHRANGKQAGHAWVHRCAVGRPSPAVGTPVYLDLPSSCAAFKCLFRARAAPAEANADGCAGRHSAALYADLNRFHKIPTRRTVACMRASGNVRPEKVLDVEQLLARALFALLDNDSIRFDESRAYVRDFSVHFHT